MNYQQDTQTFFNELSLQFRSVVAMYFYDLSPNLGGYVGENVEPLPLTEGLKELKGNNKLLLDLNHSVYITRRSPKFPISPQNIDFIGCYSESCIIPEGIVVMRFYDTLLTTDEVANIFELDHHLVLDMARTLKSDMEIFNYLLERSGIASL